MRSRWVRSMIVLTGGVVSVVAGVPYLGWLTMLPVIVNSVAVLLVFILGPHRRILVMTIIAASAAASVGLSMVALATGWTDSTQTLWAVVEVVAMLTLIGVGVWWGRAPWDYAAVALAVIANGAWLIRLVPDVGAGEILLWSLGPVVAASIGGYARYVDHRTRTSVLAATAEQRRRIERDLHDYVAHDISGILAQAQAAQFVSTHDNAALRAALAHIEEAAERALGTMDRTMLLLRENDATSAPPQAPGLAQLPAILRVFEASIDGRVESDVTGSLDGLAPEQDQLAYRMLVESLTNVRRHAPDSDLVTVAVNVEPQGLHAAVVNHRAASTAGDSIEGPAVNGGQANTERSGGTGLAEGARAVTAAGGTLQYGPTDRGWCVSLDLPSAPTAPREVFR